MRGRSATNLLRPAEIGGIDVMVETSRFIGQKHFRLSVTYQVGERIYSKDFTFRAKSIEPMPQ